MRIFGISTSLACLALASSATAQTVQSYFYDAHGRLTATTNAVGAMSGGSISNYALDGANNRASKVVEVTPGRTSANQLLSGEALTPSQFLASSDNRFAFYLQTDGNAVIYGPSGFLWATGTNGAKSVMLAMQGDGNLTIYNDARVLVWQTATNGHPGARLVMQNDGNLVLYDGATFLWSSGTGGH